MVNYFVYILMYDVLKYCRKSGEWWYKESRYYTGMTSNVKRRLSEHRMGVRSNFLHQSKNQLIEEPLVYVELVGTNYWQCIKREKQIKALSKSAKIDLINSVT